MVSWLTRPTSWGRTSPRPRPRPPSTDGRYSSPFLSGLHPLPRPLPAISAWAHTGSLRGLAGQSDHAGQTGRTLASLARAHDTRTLEDLLVRAAVCALEHSPARAAAALASMQVVAGSLSPDEAGVIAWTLTCAAARVRISARDECARIATDWFPPRAGPGLAPPASRPDARALRAVLGVGWPAPASPRTIRRASFVAEIPGTFAVGVAAAVCALARAECVVSLPRMAWMRVRRAGGNAGAHVREVRLVVRADGVRFEVSVVGSTPCAVLFFGPWGVSARGMREEFELIARECCEVAEEFAGAVAYRRRTERC